MKIWLWCRYVYMKRECQSEWCSSLFSVKWHNGVVHKSSWGFHSSIQIKINFVYTYSYSLIGQTAYSIKLYHLKLQSKEWLFLRNWLCPRMVFDIFFSIDCGICELNLAFPEHYQSQFYSCLSLHIVGIEFYTVQKVPFIPFSCIEPHYCIIITVLPCH